MKVVGCLALVVVAVVAFFAIVAFALLNTDHSALVDQVDVVVRDTEEASRRTQGGGWEVTYSYRYGGQRYDAEAFLSDDSWQPGRDLVACVDPDEPTKNAIKLYAEDNCGQDVIPGPGTTTATPRADS